MAQQRPIAIDLGEESEPNDPLERAELELRRRLEREGRIRPEEVSEALERQEAAGGRLSTALWELGLVDEVRLRSLGAQIFRVPPALPGDVANATAEVVGMLDRDFVGTYRVVPFARNKEVLLVATAEPWRLPLLDSIGSRLGCRVEPRFLDEAPLGRLLGELYDFPVDERFQAEPPKREAAVQDAEAAPEAADEESSVFGSSNQLMSETTFEAIYQGGDSLPPAAGDASEAVAPSPVEERPAPEIDAASTATIAPEDEPSTVPAPDPPHAAERSPALRLLDTVECWNAQYDTRRAAPLGLDESRAALATTADVHQLGWVLTRHALTLGQRVALLLYRSDVWMGWTGAGAGVSPETVAALMVPPQEGTLFGTVAAERTPWTGALTEHPIHDRLHHVLGGGERPLTAALVPVCLGEHVGLGIYLDGGPGGAVADSLWSIAALASEVAATLERLALRAGV